MRKPSRHPHPPRPSRAVRFFSAPPLPEELHSHTVLDRAAGPLDLFGLALDCTASGLLRLADSAILALHRAYRTREETSLSSALGTPSPAAIAAVWTPAPRPLRQALLIGSKLVDLAATHPSARTVAPRKDGVAHRFSGRQGGLKKVLSDTCPAIPYSTAMRYKKLAQRTRQALNLPPALPLEWLLSDASPSSLTADSAILAAIPRARRDFSALLRANPSQTALSRALVKTLNLYPAPLLTRASRARSTRYDFATAQATLSRYASTLSSRLTSGVPLTPPEKRALKLLTQLRAALE